MTIGLGVIIASLLAAFLFGASVANAMVGIPLNERGEYWGTPSDLIAPYTLLVGLLVVAMFMLHGVIFLCLKSSGRMANKLKVWMWRSWWCFLVMYITATIYTLVVHPQAARNFRTMPWAP